MPSRPQLMARLKGSCRYEEVAEELVIWAEVRRGCKDGDELILAATSQERQAKRALTGRRVPTR